MKERFSGKDGKRRLIQAIRESQVLLGNDEAASAIADCCELVDYQGNDYLIQQDNADNDLFILLNGSVDILVNERPVATRKAPDHVGEICLIDSKTRRTASVRAKESLLVARITEPDFTRIADEFPVLWRNLAVEISNRLRQRGQFLKAPNKIPRLFIGCSTEALSIAQQIQYGLSHDSVDVIIWTDQVFSPTSHALDDLLIQLPSFDFAIFLLMPDDIIESRHTISPGPRDNVLLEIGLFMGQLGKQRVLLIKDRDSKIRIPSDLLGLRLLDYRYSSTNPASSLGPVCHEIRDIIGKYGPR